MAVGYRLSAICWTLSAIRCLLSAGRLFNDESSASPVTLALHHRRAEGNPQLSGPKTLKPENIKNLGPVIQSPMNPLHLQGQLRHFPKGDASGILFMVGNEKGKENILFFFYDDSGYVDQLGHAAPVRRKLALPCT